MLAAAESKFDIVRIARTCDSDFEINTEQLVTKLRELDDRYGIDILCAETEAIEFYVENPATDMKPFCHELAEICSWVSTQDLEEMAEYVWEAGLVELMWGSLAAPRP